MKFVVVAALCVCALVAARAAAYEFAEDAQFISFMQFVKDNDRQYASTEEFLIRFNNFKNTLARIDRLNQNNPKAKFAVNKFSDLSVDEFKAQYLSYRPRPNRPQVDVLPPIISNAEAPTTWDWRDKGAVTDVKDQQQCGSCWAFSATEELESAWFMAGNDIPTLSPQQVVSCDTVDGGCNGGDTITAYQYIQGAGGLESDSDYPYTSGGGDSGTCQFDATKIVATMSNFSYATPPCTDSCTNQDEQTLANNLVTAPVSICVYAESWQDYSSGILTSDCPSDYSSLDHCVQLVGYDFTDPSSPYWIIRNSWNTNWGEQGYIYVQEGANLCGVADEATIVYS